jgi:hypothetical protein
LISTECSAVDGPTVRVAGLEQLGETDAVYQDIASISASLRVRSVGALYSRSKVAGMRRAFLWAYGQSDSDPVLALYELRHVLGALAASASGLSILSWRRRRALAREAIELAGRLAFVRHQPAVDPFPVPSRRDAERSRLEPPRPSRTESRPPAAGG